MLIFWKNPLLVVPFKPRWYHCSLFSQSVSQSIKLAEVPDVCTSEEWNNVIRESRTTLQKYVRNHRKMNTECHTNLASVQMVMQRLQSASHNSSHLINTFKYILESSDETASLLRWPGLITLMLSQGVGNPFAADNFISKSVEDIIWSSQVVLAEIINTLHCSVVFRKENFRVSSSKRRKNHLKEVDRLMNSYFTSSSIYKLPALKNHKVIFLLSDVLESLSKASIPTSSFNQITSKHLWEYETFHNQGVLLANGCQAAMELAGHTERSQQMAFEFGHLFTLAIKANADIQQFWNYQTTKSASLNLSGFPIVLHLENNPETLEQIYSFKEEMDNLDINQLNDKFISASSLNEAKQHLEDYVSRTLNILEEFRTWKNNEMVQYLMKLVKTLNYINEK